MNVYDFSARRIDGTEEPLARHRGRVLLIVNVASHCGFTPQYAGLQALYAAYHDRGLEILGFPCDQFGHQEPDDEAQIATFCTTRYGVTFPMFAKIDVNGAHAHPLYVHLKRARPGLLGSRAIKWNFTKFLIDRGGSPIARYAPADPPEHLAKDIEAALA